MFSLIISAVITFLATEMDDFALFVILYAENKNNKAPVFWGHMLMMIVITVMCSFISIPLSKLEPEYIRFLGIIPFALGIIYIIKNIRNDEDDESKGSRFKATGLFAASFLLTLAASGDNIGVYIPVFTEIKVQEKLIVLAIFILLQCIWSFLQIKTSALPFIQKAVEKSSKILIPVILITLGIAIFFQLFI